MSYCYDPFGRYFRTQQPPGRRAVNRYQHAQNVPRRQPTLEDYNELVQAYQELKQERDALAKEVKASQEALRQQTKKAIELKEALDAAQAQAEQRQAEIEALMQAQQASEEAEWQEQYARLQAEMENYRRRLEQRSASDVERQRRRVLEDMLSLADHLEMALKHLDRAADGELPEAEHNFRQSLEATLHAFLETLRKHGVQPLIPDGEPFDPTLHEAVGHIPSADVPEDHVAAVVRTGYRVGEDLLRPAQVLVSRGA